MTVFAIGYEDLNIDTFVSMLAEYNIGTVVDIRELPVSRKRGFSKTALAGRLNPSGLEYVHMAKRRCKLLRRVGQDSVQINNQTLFSVAPSPSTRRRAAPKRAIGLTENRTDQPLASQHRHFDIESAY